MLVTVATEAELTNRAQIYDPATNRWTPTAIHRDGGVVTTLLADGRVLVTGADCDRYGPQLYDPRADLISPAGVMAVPSGGGYTATLLRSGKVLFAGGYGGPRYINSQPQNFVQLYDPTTNTWTTAAPMLTQRWSPHSVLLADGRVLVAGGNSSVNAGTFPFLTSAEIYDPVANVWSSAGEIPTNGYGSAALSALGNGTVLAAGGGEDGRPTSSALLFDPSSRSWSKTGTMAHARSRANAMPRPDGSVLVVGGQGASGQPLTSTERFDPVSGQWVVMPSSLMTSRLDQSAIPLNDGRIFITAWPDFVFGHWSTADVQIFDPRVAGTSPSMSQAPAPLGTWSGMPEIAAPFGNYSPAGGGFSSTATATPLNDGRILLIGTAPAAATQCLFACADGISAAIYNPANGGSSLTATPTTITSYGFTATLLANGKVLVVGGGAELYDPSTDRWSTAGPVLVARIGHAATLLADGRVLVAGGLSRPPDPTAGYDRLASVNVYDPKSNNWSDAPALPFTLGDAGDTATLLRDGRVLVIGSNKSASLFDPKANRWSAVATLAEPAQLPHTAIVLPDGRVLILGSCAARPSFNCDRFATPQLFDPATDSWSRAAPMLNGREAFSATLLANGHVLVAGGYGPESVVTSGEVYDPTANRWAATADMKLARAGHIATLLRNGSVLVIGGFFLGNMRSAELYTPPPMAKAPAKSGSGSQLAWLNAPLVCGAVLLAVVVIVLLFTRLRGGRRRVISSKKL
ncbi:MAG: hypothetical protein PVSMB3_09720 [Candidatus Dormibacteraceae bacterium]